MKNHAKLPLIALYYLAKEGIYPRFSISFSFVPYLRYLLQTSLVEVQEAKASMWWNCTILVGIGIKVIPSHFCVEIRFLVVSTTLKLKKIIMQSILQNILQILSVFLAATLVRSSPIPVVTQYNTTTNYSTSQVTFEWKYGAASLQHEVFTPSFAFPGDFSYYHSFFNIKFDIY
jgi:hypothetical protein